MDGFGATERMNLSQLEREVKALQTMLRNVSGQGVSTNHGVLHIRPTQVGFAAELTSGFNSSTGYSWKQLRLSGNSVSSESTPLTGDKAFAIDDSESLTSGVLCWLEPDPTSTGYIIVSSLAGVGSLDDTCDAHSWWGGLRSDAEIAFVLSVTSASGACSCVDEAYGSIAAFDTDSWDAADNLDVCGNEYTISITVPNGIPTMTLTDAGGGSGAGPTMTLPADCWGRYWARWTFPGGPVNEDICTGAVDTQCNSDNGFTILAYCACTGSNYDGPGWYVVLEEYEYDGTTYQPGQALEINSIGQPCVALCPGGPYQTRDAAIAASQDNCWVEVICDGVTYHVPVELEYEIFDATGDFECLNGLVMPIDHGGSNVWFGTCDGIFGALGEGTQCEVDTDCADSLIPGCATQVSLGCGDSPNSAMFLEENSFHLVEFDSGNWSGIAQEVTITGDYGDIEWVLTDLPATLTGGGLPICNPVNLSGTYSILVRARA